jgi:hypothetical protein
MVKNPYRFYTYAYLREDRTPYYIGKGQGKRINSKRKNIKTPKDKSRIIFLKQNLTEDEAFKHEIYMIAMFGRKDLGTGILHNKTDGGEGSSGAIRSQKFKDNLRKLNKNKILSKEHIEKLRIANTGEKNPNYGKKASQETKEKMSQSQKGEKNPTSNWWKITYENGNHIILCGLTVWCRTNGYSAGNVCDLYKGRKKRCKDIIKIEKLN